MKVNDLTEKSIKSLKDGQYIFFDSENKMTQDVVRHKKSYNNPFYQELYDESMDLETFKSHFKNCEMFPIEQIKKPKE